MVMHTQPAIVDLSTAPLFCNNNKSLEGCTMPRFTLSVSKITESKMLLLLLLLITCVVNSI
jgi:hypothetical protein